MIIPEEAELVIPLLRGKEPTTTTTTTSVHLLTYAAPVVRRMLCFGGLTYHALPRLPVGWKSPEWLVFEVGILAGRLYFDFSDHSDLQTRLKAAEETAYSSPATSASGYQLSSKSILAFLGEWLAVRRQGQDITHTPMGYVCQGWQLRADHPFF